MVCVPFVARSRMECGSCKKAVCLTRLELLNWIDCITKEQTLVLY